MVLSVHTLVGGALGKALHLNPFTSFFVGMASHFVLDAIPHADYPLQSLLPKSNPKNEVMAKDHRLAHDLVVNGIDWLLGFLILMLFTYNSSNIWPIVASAIGAVVPDGLQFLYFMFPNVKPLAAFKRFHEFFHIRRAVEEYMEKRKVLAFAVQSFIGILALYAIGHLTFAK